ncbi:MAG: hypothetical protein A2Z11_00220 [Candidatus Woykebacteria bacterium RBG_16_43_9]|uniref:PIN domain-containing protein n=1 Tax=Candidatus Woykebacteria bacterium RBG_16_43_9 TaxID=1802596 RepID=A0A1G1WH19_9BACT|nr:MAG: hypothetical protein A2Z11_00220 [Candidatus Woykebacteria bacterium RBG_16_43_9]
MRTSRDLVLFDTNILVLAQNLDSPFYEKAIDLHHQVFEGKIKGVLANQNLLEFYSIVTNPKRLVKSLTSEKASFEIKNYVERSNFQIIKTKGNELELILNLVRGKNVKGGLVFDVYLVATMISNGIKTIYTQNEDDFIIFSEIKVINPFQ